jgi:hypothetical protein
MNKTMYILFIILTATISADISVQEAAELELRAADIRKELNIHTPTAEERRLQRIRSELNLDFDTSSKDALLGNNKPETVQSLAVSNKNESITDSIGSGLSSISKTLGMEEEENDDYSFSSTLSDFYDTVGLEKGESWGMPSVLGFNEKKTEALFGIGIFGDIEDVGTSMYKGMKYSGQSAEFTSGMMYKSSKMYNTMFGVFDDSPLNIFEEEDETSIFDVFEGGNSMLDMFD